jgi:hypothetical protein
MNNIGSYLQLQQTVTSNNCILKGRFLHSRGGRGDMDPVLVPLQRSSPRARRTELWMARHESCRIALHSWVWRSNLLPHCHTSARHVRLWVSVGWARSEIRFPYLTESIRETGGSSVWLVWDYTGSCRSMGSDVGKGGDVGTGYAVPGFTVRRCQYWGCGGNLFNKTVIQYMSTPCQNICN